MYTPHYQNQHSNWPARLPAAYAKTYAYDDCWVRTASWIIDGATNGAKIVSPMDIRRSVGKYSGNVAVDGPGGPEDEEAAIRAAGVSFNARVVSAAVAKQIMSTPGVFFWVPTDFRSWPDGKRCDPNFKGKHALGGISGARADNHVRTMDPVCRSYKWVSITNILKSMALYSKDHGLAAGTVWIGTATAPKVEPAPGPEDPQLPTTATHICRRSEGAKLHRTPNLGAVAMHCGPGSEVRATRGRSGVLYRVDGLPSHLWLEVVALDGQRLTPSLWAKELEWSSLASSSGTDTPSSNGTASPNA